MGGYRWGVDRKARLLERERTAAVTPGRPTPFSAVPARSAR
jgi:hypothetical protein